MDITLNAAQGSRQHRSAYASVVVLTRSKDTSWILGTWLPPLLCFKGFVEVPQAVERMKAGVQCRRSLAPKLSCCSFYRLGFCFRIKCFHCQRSLNFTHLVTVHPPGSPSQLTLPLAQLWVKVRQQHFTTRANDGSLRCGPACGYSELMQVNLFLLGIKLGDGGLHPLLETREPSQHCPRCAEGNADLGK